MKLIDIINRSPTPQPWDEGENIPWNDPEFSQRMLAEHLTQEHDAASRKFAKIDRHVQWIHKNVLGGKPARILDLGCGPGLYALRLARLGHQHTGIDFSPASRTQDPTAEDATGFTTRSDQPARSRADPLNLSVCARISTLWELRGGVCVIMRNNRGVSRIRLERTQS